VRGEVKIEKGKKFRKGIKIDGVIHEELSLRRKKSKEGKIQKKK